jgi:hypothetical protein
MTMVPTLMNKVRGALQSRDPVKNFHSYRYLRHNARRLEHLASLGIPVAGKSVLEVGAGIGDQSHYYLDRGCRMTITEIRADNLRLLQSRYPEQDVKRLDMERPSAIVDHPFQVVHCYGLLYHLADPGGALEFLARNCSEILFLETCVSFGDGEEINVVAERKRIPTQASSGSGCRPTRGWVFKKLQGLFDFVYVPKTQPNHEEFPLDWTAPEAHGEALSRSIFIASRGPIRSDLLDPSLSDRQQRHP